MEMKAEKRTARPLATAATLSLTPCICEMRADARAGSIFMSVSLMMNELGMSFLFGRDCNSPGPLRTTPQL